MITEEMWARVRFIVSLARSPDRLASNPDSTRVSAKPAILPCDTRHHTAEFEAHASCKRPKRLVVEEHQNIASSLQWHPCQRLFGSNIPLARLSAPLDRLIAIPLEQY